MPRTLKVVICGGGNGSQAMAGIASAQPNTEAVVLTLFQDEAQRWTELMANNDFIVSMKPTEDAEITKIKSKPKLITKFAKEAIPGADIICFIVPAFAHGQYLRAIQPFIEPGMILIGLPGQPGFTFEIRDIFEEKAKLVTVFNLESLPWVARLVDWGLHVEVPLVKKWLFGAVQKGQANPKVDPVQALQQSLGPLPHIKASGHVISIDLLSVNAYIHPPIMYGTWHKWDGKPMDESPLFYHGCTKESAEYVNAVSNEVVEIAKAIQKQRPAADTKEVITLYEWYKSRHADYVKDFTDMSTVFLSNSAYNGLRHPMVKDDNGKFVKPDYKHRYLTEDIPYGLLVLKGIGEVAGVETPVTDKILTFLQEKMGKEYLIGSKVKGKDIVESRAPQRYCLNKLDSMLGFH